MASVPVKDLRPLADWRDELGLDRLRADLIDGDLDACWYDHATGEFHQIPRAHWQREKAVEHAIGWGWRIGGDLFSSGGRLCAIHAARPAKHAGGRKPKYDWPSAYNEMRRYVRKNGWPKKQAPLVSHIEHWFEQQDKEPSNSTIREHVNNFFAGNSVSGKKAPPRSKST
jgi:hypothetical protein